MRKKNIIIIIIIIIIAPKHLKWVNRCKHRVGRASINLYTRNGLTLLVSSRTRQCSHEVSFDTDWLFNNTHTRSFAAITWKTFTPKIIINYYLISDELLQINAITHTDCQHALYIVHLYIYLFIKLLIN
jgi:hypothetical protein